jgi:hypothetical protein
MRDRRLAAAWAVAGLMLASMAAFVLAAYTLPGDSAVLQVSYRASARPWEVSAPSGVAGGLRTGDVVLALDGRPLEAWLHGAVQSPLARAGAATGDLRYTVQRGAQVLTVVEPQVRRDFANDLRANWSYFVFMLALQVAGVLLALRRPALPAARALLLLSSAITSSSVVFFLSLRPSDIRFGWLLLLFFWCTVPLFGLVAAGALHFTLVFPRVQPALQRRPWLLPALYAGAWLPYGLTLALQWPTARDWALRGALLLAATNSITVTYFPLMLLNTLRVYAHTTSAVERRQLRWTVWGFAGAVLPWLLLTVVPSVLGVPGLLPGAWVGLTWCLIPASLAIAILHEGLFDIDVIIHRTLVYGGLSGILAAVYFGLVVVLQAAVQALTGQARSTLATVLSTLAIAALFSPLRARVQRAIDRRFYRRKYDAARALAAFGGAARSLVDLEPLTDQLLRVVDDTMQPRHVALWLPGRSRPIVPPPAAWRGQTPGGRP